MTRFGLFSITQSKVHSPVGPAPMTSTVSPSVISEIRAAQKPVASRSPTNRACSSLTASGIRFRPRSHKGPGHTPPDRRRYDIPTPSPLRVGAIVHIAAAAEETLAAKGLDVHRHPVTNLHRGNLRPHLLHHSHHLVSDGDARHRTGHAAVLDMQVARTNTAQRHAYDRIARPCQFRYRLSDSPNFPCSI